MTERPGAVRFLAGGEARIGALSGETIRDAGPSGPRGFVPTSESWAQIDAATGEGYALDDVVLLPPVVPGKVICIGINYKAHAAETGREPPEIPVVFAKYPSCLVGHEASIVLPPEESRPDFEGELAVVFCETFTRATRANALSRVGGYTAFNDVSGRWHQRETPLRQFTLAKSFDTFGPIGPCLVRTEGADLTDLNLTTVVSGETMQDTNTSDLIFPVDVLVEYISRATTIEAGDVLATGTPGGVGDGRTPPRYLQPGDVVEISITGVPTLKNPVVAER
jgi:2-keto-4-pentenoate hydratase/2-oxohepta-3-ene-1,7-dioic acid hydratase in catechol pathway